jgi:hypothetical protein
VALNTTNQPNQLQEMRDIIGNISVTANGTGVI